MNGFCRLYTYCESDPILVGDPGETLVDLANGPKLTNIKSQ